MILKSLSFTPTSPVFDEEKFTRDLFFASHLQASCGSFATSSFHGRQDSWWAAIRILTVLDEYTRECLAILVERHITSQDVIDKLFELFIFRTIPDYIRSDNGPEFTNKATRSWLSRMGVKSLFIEPGSPWENEYIESFNGKLRNELLNREVFTTLMEAKVLIEKWRQEHNTVRPHSALRYRPPAPEAVLTAALT